MPLRRFVGVLNRHSIQAHKKVSLRGRRNIPPRSASFSLIALKHYVICLKRPHPHSKHVSDTTLKYR